MDQYQPPLTIDRAWLLAIGLTLILPALTGALTGIVLRRHQVPWRLTLYLSLFTLCLAGTAQDYLA